MEREAERDSEGGEREREKERKIGELNEWERVQEIRLQKLCSSVTN